MNFVKIAFPFLVIACFVNGAAQSTPKVIQTAPLIGNLESSSAVLDDQAKLKNAALSPELTAKLISFLKSTGKEASSLSLPENRVRFASDIANLLWPHDEKLARELFLQATNDFRSVLQSIEQLDQSREAGELDDELLLPSFNSPGSGNLGRFYSAKNLRRTLLLTIAERDGELAFNFYRETERDQIPDWNDSWFEVQLGNTIARNNPARAFQLAQRKLAKNDYEGLKDLIDNIYKKDPTKAAQLAAETLGKLRTAKVLGVDDTSAELSLFDSAVKMLAEKTAAPDKTLLLSEGEVRELAEIITRCALESQKRNSYWQHNIVENRIEHLKKYAPAATAKLASGMNSHKSEPPYKIGIKTNEAETEAASAAVTRKGKDTAAAPTTAQTEFVLEAKTNDPTVDSSTAARVASDAARRGQERAAQLAALEKLMTAANDPNSKVSVEEVRHTLAAIRSRSLKLAALTRSAKAIAERGDKDAAKSLLAEASEMQVAEPHKAIEMLQNLLLADAHAAIEPESAFVILENTIAEFNTVVASYARVANFMEASIIADNGAFNMSSLSDEAKTFITGNSVYGLQLNKILKNLIEADFHRTVGLAEKFDKPEIQIAAKFLIASVLLSGEEVKK